MQVMIHHATTFLGKMHTAWIIFLDEIFVHMKNLTESCMIFYITCMQAT